MSSTEIVPWVPSAPQPLPVDAEPPDVVRRAVQLSERDQLGLVRALESGAYEMVASLIWSKALAVLRKQLAGLGMEFVGEMLGRSDLNESSNPLTEIREDEAIELAEQLGMINTTEAIRLRGGQTLVNHFLDPEVSRSEKMLLSEVATIIHSCVANFLSEPSVRPPTSFLDLRAKLESQTLRGDSREADTLAKAPYFYVRTTLTVLLAQLKVGSGAKLEHAAGNFSSLLPAMWPRLRDKDRWQTGEAYALAQADNRLVAARGLRGGLMKVKGFDFVPETLRSDTFRNVARAVLNAHFAYDNFHNEPKPMQALAALGSSVPGPALADCFTAALCVRLGNRYGYSHSAQPAVDRFLKLIRAEQWEAYLNNMLRGDATILEKIGYHDSPARRWLRLVDEMGLDGVEMNTRIARVVTADPTKLQQAMNAARKLRDQIMVDT